MVSAWCSDDAQGALTALKRGEGIPETYCENHPVSSQFELGQLVGITGTPGDPPVQRETAPRLRPAG